MFAASRRGAKRFCCSTASWRPISGSALRSFTHDGLSQVNPTLIELQGVLRDLHNVVDRLDNHPARYILGRNAPREFDPK